MELKEIVLKIDTLKEQADAFGELPKDAKERLEQKIRMEWNYHSNVIEGNSLDYGETRSLLLWGITAKGKPLKDHLDLEGHNEAIKKLEAIADKEIPITESLIIEFHRLILAEPFDDYRKEIQPGKYKETDNYLYNYRGERVDFCTPAEVPVKLNELINWTNNAIDPPKRKKKKYDIHPLLIATRFHYEFINIHPFDDGNGRLARIFMNLILMQCGYPPIIVNKDLKDQYYRAIEDSRERGIEVLAEFLGEQLIKSQELYLKAAKGETIEEPDDLDKKIALLAKKLEGEEDILEYKRSPKEIGLAYENIIEPFLDKLFTKAESFNKLFCFVKLFYYRVGSNDIVDGLQEISFLDYKRRWKNLINNGTRFDDDIILSFETFKKESLPFDSQILLSINLEEFRIIIKGCTDRASYKEIDQNDFMMRFSSILDSSDSILFSIQYHKNVEESLLNDKVNLLMNKIYQYVEEALKK